MSAPTRTLVPAARDRLAAAASALARRERALWALALLALSADLALTRHGLAQGLVERNPLARTALRSVGFPALVGVKLGALGVAVGGRLALPDRYGALPPLLLSLPWTLAVCVNLLVIAAT